MYRTTALMLWILLLSCSAFAQASVPLREYLEGLAAGASADIGGYKLRSPRSVAAFYLNRNHAPLWTNGGPLQNALSELVEAIGDSRTHGFNTARYHIAALRNPDQLTDVAIELLATDAFLSQVRHRTTGVVSPRQLDADWHLIPAERDNVAILQMVVSTSAGVRASLNALWPAHAEYAALVDERLRIDQLGDTMTVPVPGGALLRPGQSSERILLLKERLLGPGEHSALYDDDLQRAVVALQRSAGLEPDALVGDATLEVLNATRFSWIDRIDANLERWRWLPNVLPSTMVRVNIASFYLRAVRNGEQELGMRVVVGRPYRNTPVFTEAMKYMVLNPFWNVPVKLATEDKLPQLRRDPDALRVSGFEVKPAGSDAFVDVAQIDWSGVTRRNFSYLLRQRPGPGNALGQIKFMMPNPFAVYLHDTNDRSLFNKQERSFSSGCIRLSQPLDLAEWVLRNEGRDTDAADVRARVAGGETSTLHLRNPLPVYIVYFTAFQDDDDVVVFRRDIYKRDQAIVDALRSDA